jgi:hypothetical protein
MPREKSPPTPSARKAAPRQTLARKPPAPTVMAFTGPGQRAALIAQAAYFRAEKRGFVPGNELQDWLAAEAEVDAGLLRGAAPTDSPAA